MRYKNGVSLTVLIVTIVIMTLISGIIVVQVGKIGGESNALEFINQMKQIEVAVEKERYKKEEDTSYQYKGNLIVSPVTVGTQTYPSVTNTGSWYEVNTTNLEEMGLRLIEGEYIINYDTLNVVSVTGIEFEYIMYYTLNDILAVIDVE